MYVDLKQPMKVGVDYDFGMRVTKVRLMRGCPPRHAWKDPSPRHMTWNPRTPIQSYQEQDVHGSRILDGSGKPWFVDFSAAVGLETWTLDGFLLTFKFLKVIQVSRVPFL